MQSCEDPKESSLLVQYFIGLVRCPLHSSCLAMVGMNKAGGSH